MPASNPRASQLALPSPEILAFYTEQSALTSPGRYAAAFDTLPGDPIALARIVQGLVLHKYMAKAYGVEIPPSRGEEVHTRRVESMLDQIFAFDDRPLPALRAPEKRLFGICCHFTTLLVAMLRAKGIPARERAGFGAYFNPPWFEQHVVCEYWSADDERWILLDAQFDETWRGQLKIAHDPFDVPRDKFLIATDAWTLCRTGKADADRFGIFNGNKRGLWFVAVELVRDVAALNRMEVLVWDVWGAMPEPSTLIGAKELAYFDQLAAVTRDPDGTFDDLMALYRYDQGVQVPPVVFNVITNRPEAV